MIKANELRIGNWLKWNGLEGTVKNISTDTNMGNAEPIHLTPEVLEKCGFIKKDNAWLQSEYGVFGMIYCLVETIDSDRGFYEAFWGELDIGVLNVRWLHQLQNMFFALTGEELEYRP